LLDDQKKALESEGTASMWKDVSMGSIGRLPNFSRIKDADGLMVKNKKVSNCNRYLAFQETRIRRSLANGEVKRAVLI
jgi:hypothetical protein